MCRLEDGKADALYVGDIVESNGKTVKENNFDTLHDIPLGSLVEVGFGVEHMGGVRLFVVGFTRDCDGTPLYILCASKEDKDYRIGSILVNKKYTGFSKECLTFVR